MAMVINILVLIAGFYLLYKGAHWLVTGASRIADSLSISKVVVGATLVAFGTSAPELFVNMIAAARGKTGFALSNVSGSNLTNLCIGFGLCGLIGVLAIERKRFLKDLLVFAGAPLVIVLFLALTCAYSIPFWAVIFLLGPFCLYIYSMKARLIEELSEDTVKHNLGPSIIIFLVGVAGLYVAGELVLRTSISIGKALGLSDSIMGLTVVAIGTSIPDVAASVIAFKKKEGLIAVGNLLGSNIFNVLLVLSGTILVSFKGLTGDEKILIDYGLVFGASLLFMIFVLFRQRIGRFTGAILLGGYVIYMIARVINDLRVV